MILETNQIHLELFIPRLNPKEGKWCSPLKGLQTFRDLLMKGGVLIPEAEAEPTAREMDPGGRENFTFDLSGTEAQTLLIWFSKCVYSPLLEVNTQEI